MQRLRHQRQPGRMIGRGRPGDSRDNQHVRVGIADDAEKLVLVEREADVFNGRKRRASEFSNCVNKDRFLPCGES